MKTVSALIVAAAALMPAVAIAAPKPAASVEAPSSEATAAKVAPRRYCVNTASMTGSRIERRECRTLDAWLAKGFDPRVK